MKPRPQLIDITKDCVIDRVICYHREKHDRQFNYEHHPVWNSGGAWCKTCGWRWDPPDEMFE